MKEHLRCDAIHTDPKIWSGTYGRKGRRSLWVLSSSVAFVHLPGAPLHNAYIISSRQHVSISSKIQSFRNPLRSKRTFFTFFVMFPFWAILRVGICTGSKCNILQSHPFTAGTDVPVHCSNSLTGAKSLWTELAKASGRGAHGWCSYRSSESSFNNIQLLDIARKGILKCQHELSEAVVEKALGL